MGPDDELCLCFHVTRRKVVNFLRVERPKRVGQLSECFGAGTGCGWCRPYLKRLFEQAVSRLHVRRHLAFTLPHRQRAVEVDHVEQGLCHGDRVVSLRAAPCPRRQVELGGQQVFGCNIRN